MLSCIILMILFKRCMHATFCFTYFCSLLVKQPHKHQGHILRGSLAFNTFFVGLFGIARNYNDSGCSTQLLSRGVAKLGCQSFVLQHLDITLTPQIASQWMLHHPALHKKVIFFYSV